MAKYTAKEMIEALRKTKGMTTLAAREIGCSVNTLKKYMGEMPSVMEAYEEEKSAFDDTVRLKMIQKIQEGDTAMIIFYAKCRLADFSQKQQVEITGKDGGAIILKTGMDLTEL